MTLLRRRPREIYRVYSEEEYLNGAGSELGGVAELPIVDSSLSTAPSGHGAEDHRLRRVTSVAMLAGAVFTVGVVVFLNVAGRHRGGVPRRGSLVAATRSSRAVRSPAADDAQPQVISSRAALVRSAETARPRVLQLGRRSLRRPVSRRSSNFHIDPLPRRRGDVAVVADHAPRRSSGAASAAPVATPAPAPASATTTSSAAPSAPENRSEFGFER